MDFTEFHVVRTFCVVCLLLLIGAARVANGPRPMAHKSNSAFRADGEAVLTCLLLLYRLFVVVVVVDCGPPPTWGSNSQGSVRLRL